MIGFDWLLDSNSCLLAFSSTFERRLLNIFIDTESGHSGCMRINCIFELVRFIHECHSESQIINHSPYSPCVKYFLLGAMGVTECHAPFFIFGSLLKPKLRKQVTRIEKRDLYFSASTTTKK